jgi:HSP20 family protein
MTPARNIPIHPAESLKKRFRPRADTAYNIRSKHLTHVCELPGVKRSDIKLSLAICIYNGIRVIELEGISRPFFTILDGDDEEGIVRERYYGHFYRMFPVPFDTTVRRLAPISNGLLTRMQEEDVVASMADGLLILRIHCRSAPNSKAEVEASRRTINIVS